MQYLADMECPLDSNAASSASSEVVDWLLHYAVDLAYEDNGEHPVSHAGMSMHLVGVELCSQGITTVSSTLQHRHTAIASFARVHLVLCS